jgi:hypothetical protein
MGATRIYYGQWGSAPFQSLCDTGSGSFQSLFMMPEWYLVNLALALIGALGFQRKPLLSVLPLLAISVGLPMLHACAAAARSRFQGPGSHFPLKLLTALLHILQPAARLHGRLVHGLNLWRRRVPCGFVLPVPRQMAVWMERWQAPEGRLEGVESFLRKKGIAVRRGGECDDWDLQIPGGFWGGARLLMAVEDHGAGTQYVRCRVQPKCFIVGLILSLALAFLAAAAGLDGAWSVCLLLGIGALGSVSITVRDCGGAAAAFFQAVRVNGISDTETKHRGSCLRQTRDEKG